MIGTGTPFDHPLASFSRALGAVAGQAQGLEIGGVQQGAAVVEGDDVIDLDGGHREAVALAAGAERVSLEMRVAAALVSVA